MKPAFLSYHGGQLCASLHHPPLSLVLECVLFYIYSHFLLINPYKCTQEKDVLRKGKVKNGTFIESKISQKHSRANSERNRCSRISSYFMALRPFHSKSTNSSIFQVRRWPVMMLAVKMHQPGEWIRVSPTEKALPSSVLGWFSQRPARDTRKYPTLAFRCWAGHLARVSDGEGQRWSCRERWAAVGRLTNRVPKVEVDLKISRCVLE